MVYPLNTVRNFRTVKDTQSRPRTLLTSALCIINIVAYGTPLSLMLTLVLRHDQEGIRSTILTKITAVNTMRFVGILVLVSIYQGIDTLLILRFFYYFERVKPSQQFHVCTYTCSTFLIGKRNVTKFMQKRKSFLRCHICLNYCLYLSNNI